MFKKILCLIAALITATAFAAVDVNKASAADLDGIKGIGPSLSGKIMAERQKSPFKSWTDLITRVNGIGPASAGKFSAEGLTVNGSSFSAGKAPDPKDKKAEKKPPATPAAK